MLLKFNEAFMWNIDLKGKKAFIAGIGDDQGFGWAIAKSLAEAGAEILIGTWVPVVKITSSRSQFIYFWVHFTKNFLICISDWK